MAYSFRGGIHPHDYKKSTRHKAIEELPAPAKVILPMSMHIGAPCSPVVSVGDIVDIGQKIADSTAPVSAPIHASISGKVVAIEPALHSNGSKVMSVIVENDGENRLHESVRPLDFDKMSQDERIEAVRSGGIVGHGGATFPTHIKLKSAVGKVDTIILNGAECEPYITSDHRLLLEKPEEVIGGARLLSRILGVDKVCVAVEQNKKDTFPRLRELIDRETGMKLYPLKCKYPQGAEKQLILAVTGREVPSGQLPADAGCAVFNVDTAAAVYRLFTTGMPDVTRVVTCAGSAVENPKNLRAPLGTPVSALVEACGGFAKAPNKLLFGGLMMGVSVYNLDAPVIKGTNAFLALAGKEYRMSSNPTCIRCGKCVAACPIHLMPCQLYKHGQARQYDICETLGALDCIECGACAYECPGRLPLVQQHRINKRKIMEQKKK